jgi:hypothetical protein
MTTDRSWDQKLEDIREADGQAHSQATLSRTSSKAFSGNDRVWLAQVEAIIGAYRPLAPEL